MTDKIIVYLAITDDDIITVDKDGRDIHTGTQYPISSVKIISFDTQAEADAFDKGILLACEVWGDKYG